jgi:hypothetical protein
MTFSRLRGVISQKIEIFTSLIDSMKKVFQQEGTYITKIVLIQLIRSKFLKILVGVHEGKIPHEKQGRRWDDSVKLVVLDTSSLEKVQQAFAK